MHSEHGFDQAPYEEITEDRYKELIAGLKDITKTNIGTEDLNVEECSKGVCPIK